MNEYCPHVTVLKKKTQLPCIYSKYSCNTLQVAQCAFTLVLMAVFWMTEALPLAVTALLPAFLFPLFGIMKSSVVSFNLNSFLSLFILQEFATLLDATAVLSAPSKLASFHKQVATMYFKDFHLLLLGIICLATSTEKWGLHWRIALGLVIVVGVNPGMWVLFSFFILFFFCPFSSDILNILDSRNLFDEVF